MVCLGFRDLGVQGLVLQRGYLGVVGIVGILGSRGYVGLGVN